MAITKPGVFEDFGLDVWSNAIAANLTTDTFKGALFGDTITPDFTLNGAAYGTAPYTAGNDLSPVAGGDTLTGNSLTISGDFLVLDFADLVMSQGDITDATGLLIYDTTIVNRALCLLTFAAAVNLTNGILTVEFDATGVWRNRYVPA